MILLHVVIHFTQKGVAYFSINKSQSLRGAVILSLQYNSTYRVDKDYPLLLWRCLLTCTIAIPA